MGSGEWETAIAVFLCGFLILWPMAPVWSSPTSILLGGALDSAHHAWGLWWFAQPGREGDITTWVSFPAGERGSLLGPVVSMGMQPLVRWGGAVLAYNASIVVLLAFSTGAVAVAAAQVSGRAAAPISAVAFLVGRASFVHAGLGVTEGLAVGWVFLALAVTIYSSRCRGRRAVVLDVGVGFLCGVAVIENPYALFLLGPGAVLWAVVRLWQGRVLGVVGAGSAGLGVTLTRLLYVGRGLGGNLHPSTRVEVWGWSLPLADPHSWVQPGALVWPWPVPDLSASEEHIMAAGGTAYLGILPLLMGLSELHSCRGRWLVGAAAVCVVLSFGSLPFGYSGPVGPFLLFNAILEWLGPQLTQPPRFLIYAGGFLAMAAGSAVASWGLRARLVFLVLLGIEALVLGGPALPQVSRAIPPASCFATLDAGVVLTVSGADPMQTKATALLLQTLHGRPGTHHGIGGWAWEPSPPGLRESLERVDAAVRKGEGLGRILVIDAERLHHYGIDTILAPAGLLPGAPACDGWAWQRL